MRASERASFAARPDPLASIVLSVLALTGMLAVTVVATASLVARQTPKLDLGTDNLVPLAKATARRPSAPTTVFAADGSQLGQYLPSEQFQPIAPDAIPPLVATIVTASEDPNFYSHHGVDVTAVVRAALTNASAGTTVEGGSTITQQLAKNLYTDGAHTVARKLREVAIAVDLEKRYTKQELFAAYLNSTYFGEGAIGIRAAAGVYFGKPVEQLDVSELALLAGLIPAPSERDPRVHPDLAEAARQHVLDRVAATHHLDENTVTAARAQLPALAPPPVPTPNEPFFMEYVRQWLLNVAHLPEEQVLGGGLRVETSLDPGIQSAAEGAVASHLSDPAGPTGSLVVLDHRNGHVIALVGGPDWNASKVDLALGADGGGTGRQAGSAFKPFVLATALKAGFRPDDPLPAPATLDVGADQSVQNYSGNGYGTVSLTDATVHSINTAYEWLTQQVGPQQVRDMATALGINHLPARGIGPSIGLGAYETSPMDMAAAYGTIAEDGHRVTPVPVTRVVAPDGTVLVDNTAPPPGKPVLDPAICRTVTDLLGQVIDRGTGTAAKIDRPAAGKTGTTDEFANAWFVGYTPQLVGAVWVGYPTANTPMHGVDGVRDVAGGTIPAEIWHDVMLAASAPLPPDQFAPLLPLPPGNQQAGAGAAPAATPPPSSSGTGGGRPKHHGH